MAVAMSGCVDSSTVAAMLSRQGRANTVERVDALIEAVAQSVAHLRRISPVSAHA
jgi:hypothetical protein